MRIGYIETDVNFSYPCYSNFYELSIRIHRLQHPVPIVLIRVYHLIKSITSIVQAHISSLYLNYLSLTSHTCMYNYYNILHHTTSPLTDHNVYVTESRKTVPNHT